VLGYGVRVSTEGRYRFITAQATTDLNINFLEKSSRRIGGGGWGEGKHSR